MANSIYLKDGSVEYIFHEEETPEYYDDFQRIIYEKLGREAELIVIQLRKAADYNKKKVETDLLSYESSLESNATCFMDILESLNKLNNLLLQQRLNRSKLSEIVSEIIKNINNQI